jgi:hypothetical protein
MTPIFIYLTILNLIGIVLTLTAFHYDMILTAAIIGTITNILTFYLGVATGAHSMVRYLHEEFDAAFSALDQLNNQKENE